MPPTLVTRLANAPKPKGVPEIREGISGTLCRCTGYANAIMALGSVAETEVLIDLNRIKGLAGIRRRQDRDRGDDPHP